MAETAIRIPADITLSPEQLTALVAANPGTLIVNYVDVPASSPSPVAADGTVHREAVSATVGMIEAALHTGVSVIPVLAPFAGLVDSILDGGVEAVARMLSGTPQRERWPLEAIRTLNAKIQALTPPKT